MLKIDSSSPTPNSVRLTRISALVYTVMSLIGVAYLIVAGRLSVLWPQPDSVLGRNGFAENLDGNLGLGMLLGLSTVLFTDQTLVRFAAGDYLERKFREALGGLTARQAVFLACLSGVGEELLFRGVVYGWLASRMNVLPALLLSSVVFAVAHVGPDRRFLWWTLFAFGMGILLAASFHLGGCLILPIVIHATVNGLNLVRESWRQSLPAGNLVS